MSVDRSGKPTDKTLIVQPVAYMDENIVVHDDASSTEGQVNRMFLVQ